MSVARGVRVALVIVATSLICLSLVGCGAENKSDPTPAPASTSSPAPTSAPTLSPKSAPTPTPTPSPTPAPPTPAPTSASTPEPTAPPCTAEQQVHCTQCTSEFEGCVACEANYVVEKRNMSNASVGFCVAACIKEPNQAALPAAPAKPLDLNGIAWPQMCVDKSDAHFFGIGDWGGGWGEPGESWANPGVHRPRVDADIWAQRNVADQMKNMAKTVQPDYILNVGDNFYPGGIDHHCGNDAQDAAERDVSGQFKNHFDAMYEGEGLSGKPWLSVFGNHDYGGVSFVQGWDVQIYKTWVSPDTWRLPGQFWSQRVQYKDFAVDLFFLDSNFQDAHSDPIHDICGDGDKCWGIDKGECPKWLDAAWSDSVKMLKAGLEKSTAEWRIIVTHFPGPSIAANPLIQEVKDDIDLIFTGHKHTQEFGTTAGMDWIISGGGGGITADAGPNVPSGDDIAYGFVDFSISRTEMKFDMITWTGLNKSSKTLQLKDRKKGAASKASASKQLEAISSYFV